VELGRLREALEEADRCVRVAREAHETGFEISGLSARSAALAELGDLGAAGRSLEEATSLASDLPAESSSSLGLSLRRSRLALLRGRVDEARETIQASVELMQRRRMRNPFLARALRARAEILRGMGDGASAVRDARAALEVSQALQGRKPFSLYTGRSWLLLARLRLDQGDREGTRAAAQAALEHLSDMLGDEHPETAAARALARQ
jgi:tetratricopeptide (TPR) repeat protein